MEYFAEAAFAPQSVACQPLSQMELHSGKFSNSLRKEKILWKQKKRRSQGNKKKKLLWKQQKKNMQTGKIKNRKKFFIHSPTQNLEGGAVADELRQTGIEGEWGVVSPLVSPDHY